MEHQNVMDSNTQGTCNEVNGTQENVGVLRHKAAMAEPEP
jgi:hypothetical protein